MIIPKTPFEELDNEDFFGRYINFSDSMDEFMEK